MSLWRPFALCCLLVLAVRVQATSLRYIPLPERVATSDCIAVGVITDAGAKTVRLTPPYGGDPIPYALVGFSTSESLFAPEDEAKSFAFAVPRTPKGELSPEMPTFTKGQRVLLFLRRPMRGTTYFLNGYFGAIGRPAVRHTAGEDFAKSVSETRRLIRLKTNPNAGLASPQPEDRMLAAWMLLTRYAQPPDSSEGFERDTLPIEESKPLLQALIPMAQAHPNDLRFLFQRWGLKEEQGWEAQRYFDHFEAHAAQWLRENAERYRLQRWIPMPDDRPSPEQKREVEQFLKEWSEKKLVEQAEIDRIKKMGRKALGALSEFLLDKELGFFAETALMQIDGERATSYLLRVVPKREPETQIGVLRDANRRMHEYAMHWIQGNPQPKPGAPPPRFPTQTTPYPYRKEIRDIARAVLANPNPDYVALVREAMLALGWTGTKSDLPLLQKLANLPARTDYWEGNYPVIRRAAMARLGDAEAFRAILAELKQPIKTVVLEKDVVAEGGRGTRAGTTVTPREEGVRFWMAVQQAEYLLDRRLVAALMLHLDAPKGAHHGDYSDPSPSYLAVRALDKIVFGSPYKQTPAEWKEWWKTHQRQYPQP